MGCAGALQSFLLQRGLRGFFAGVDDRVVEVDVVVLVGFVSAVVDAGSVAVGELLRRFEGGSNERVAPEASCSSATVEDGDSGCESMSRRALVSTAVSALRKLRRLATVCVGRMLSLIAVRGVLLAGCCAKGDVEVVMVIEADSLLPSAITTLMEMLLGESSLLEVVEEMEFDREGIVRLCVCGCVCVEELR